MPLFIATPAIADEVVEPVVVVVTTPGGDDSSYQVPLTTTVTFDGVEYSSVYATTNSVITFGQPDGTYWTYPSTPSISLYSMDWVVYPQNRADEHLIIRASDGGFQVDISARPIWLQNATEPTNINIVAAINTDGTVSISYSLTGPTYEGQTRTGVRLTDGSIVTLEEYGVVQVTEPPVLEPEPVAPTPTPTPTPEPTIEPTPEPTPTVEPTPTPEPTPTIVPPTVPEGATLLSEGSTLEVIAPPGQRIVSVTAWYGDPADSTRGIEVSSNITQLASGQTSVTIESSNIYGDPAPGTVKTLIFIVNYEPIPTPEPTPGPQPEPTIDPVPPVVVPEPPVIPQPEPTVEPTPEPTVEPTPEPTVEPEPEVIPEPSPEPEVEIPVTEEEVVAAVEELAKIAPEELTDEQAVVLLAAAEMVLETALEGSAEYEAALDALAVVAQADDPELPAELAAIPGAAAVLETFNAIGNMGADMSPATREEAEKIVVAGVVAVNAALSASLVINAGTPPVPSAPAAPSSPSGGSSGASSSGSGSARRKE